MNELSFLDYDKLTDNIIYLTEGVTLKFVVSFSSKNKDGTRKPLHSEFRYTSKYQGTRYSYSMLRSMKYYFIIDLKNDFANSIVIKQGEQEILNMIYNNEILPWFFGNDDQKAYKLTDDEKLVLKDNDKKCKVSMERGKMIIKPTVVDNDIYVNIDINGIVSFDMQLVSFLGFMGTLVHTDMYNAACSIVNYARTGPYGINMVDILSDRGSNGLGGSPLNSSGFNMNQNNFLSQSKSRNIKDQEE